jgi:hypothetical protein
VTIGLLQRMGSPSHGRRPVQARPAGARTPSPWDSATPLGRLLFCFPLPLMLRAHRVPGGLQPEMMPEIPETDWPLLKKRCGAVVVAPSRHKPTR